MHAVMHAGRWVDGDVRLLVQKCSGMGYAELTPSHRPRGGQKGWTPATKELPSDQMRQSLETLLAQGLRQDASPTSSRPRRRSPRSSASSVIGL